MTWTGEIIAGKRQSKHWNYIPASFLERKDRDMSNRGCEPGNSAIFRYTSAKSIKDEVKKNL